MSRGALRVAATAVALLAAVGPGCATKMTSELEGSRSPRTVPCTPGETVRVENGDFTIFQKCLFADGVVGDGVGEVTLWEFDLSGRDYRKALEEGCGIRSAVIELRIERAPEPETDSLRVRGEWELGLEEIANVPPGERRTIEIDMMSRAGRRSPYDPETIRRLVLEEPSGKLPMQYELDAVISKAKLTVLCQG